MARPLSPVFSVCLLALALDGCSSGSGGAPSTGRGGSPPVGGGSGSGGSTSAGSAGSGLAGTGGRGGAAAGVSGAGLDGAGGSTSPGGSGGGEALQTAGGGGHAGSTGGAGAGPGGAGTGGGPGGASGGSAPAGSAGRGAGGGGGLTEGIHYYGRWNRLADRAITVNTGSHLVAQFSGTGVSARFDTAMNQSPSLTLSWRTDGGAWQEGELAATVMLASNLTAGSHELTLMVRGLNENQSRWTPPLVSSITFLGLDVTGGALQPSLRPVRPKIEFLGDSITEGINLWDTHNGQSTPPWRSDARRAYASLTAQTLGAEWRQVGFGRQGLLIGGNGGVPVANDAFNWIYSGVPRDDWQPDLVVINQGTNDSGASASSFRAAYGTFVGTIRAAYPGAKIAAMRPFNGSHAAEITAEVDARRSAGDSRVSYIDTTGWLGSADYTDGTHPNEQGSQKAADALVTAIRAIGFPQ